jgi:hypothetical protein
MGSEDEHDHDDDDDKDESGDGDGAGVHGVSEPVGIIWRPYSVSRVSHQTVQGSHAGSKDATLTYMSSAAPDA